MEEHDIMPRYHGDPAQRPRDQVAATPGTEPVEIDVDGIAAAAEGIGGLIDSLTGGLDGGGAPDVSIDFGGIDFG